MPDLTAKRTLVKSPPELWSELSEVESLARHLGEFGEINITRTEPETTVAWEGEHASGTVAIEASGWGTKVVLTASLPEREVVAVEPDPAPEPAPDPEPPAPKREPRVLMLEPEVEPEPEPEPVVVPEPPKAGFFARMFGRPPEPVAVPGPEPEPERAKPEPIRIEVLLVDGKPLDSKPAPELEPAPEPEPEVGAIDVERAQAVLDATLDTLGAAHHRPFSRG
jgi:hypothetical protein